TFNIAVLQSDIRIIHVNPITDPLGEFTPLFFVIENTFFTLFDELLDAIRLDFLLSRNAELLFNLYFHRQTVSIPATFSHNLIALHGFIAPNEVLDDTSEYVTGMWKSIRGRWPFVKHKRFRTFPLIHLTMEHILIIPILLDTIFTLDC